MQQYQWDSLYINGQIATMADEQSCPYGLLRDSALAIKDGLIAWVGPMQSLPDMPERLAKTIYDLAGRCVTPGLIDCHTHLVYAGNRYYEFELRLQGASYETIARADGGISSTVTATRMASFEDLLEQSLKRAKHLVAEGVTTIEIKSGYGLNLDTELKILRVAKRIGEILPVTVSLTFLGAHSLPLEYKDKPDEYIDSVCHDMLPVIVGENLVNSVDVFCENIAFDLAQTERVFKTAREFNLGVKCHAEQLSDMGGAALAAQYNAVSVDHLEFLSAAGVDAMAKSGTVAVLLPGAFYFLRETHLPPIDLLRKAGVPIAIATDCNPGTSPVTSLLLMLNMASTLFRLTPEEALKGVTRYAAKALGLQATHGTLSVGKVADFVVWDIEHPAELVYHIGFNPLIMAVKDGVKVSSVIPE
ncbi:MAG: imidazolonepropionase [Gammaproteobacteria bacterium]|nr:imidazolonepropionase [Gammaproteobacteria bacterium]